MPKTVFHLDGVFVPRDCDKVGNTPLPIIAAVEHENKHDSFEQEIVKLAHIRSPLKVGIRYCAESEAESARARIQR